MAETSAMLPPFKNLSEAALYLWDYFYVANYPARGDEAAWKRIEQAASRIRDSEPYLDQPPVDVQLRSARRVRDSARVGLRSIQQLSVAPASWTIDQFAELEALATILMELLSEPASLLIVH